MLENGWLEDDISVWGGLELLLLGSVSANLMQNPLRMQVGSHQVEIPGDLKSGHIIVTSHNLDPQKVAFWKENGPPSFLEI